MRGLQTLTALVLGLACAACLPAARLDPRTAQYPPVRFEPPAPTQARLSGGATAVLLEDPTVPLVRVFLGFRGGSLHEPAELAGLADVTALAWRTGGVEGYTGEAFDEAVEDRGISLSLRIGRGSGWVSLSCLPGDVEFALDLAGRLLLRPALEGGRVEWAKRQVGERLRREVDDPGSLAFREFRRALYQGHPRGVIATAETVARIDRTDVVALRRRLVEEGWWIVGAVGDFSAAEMQARLEEQFGNLPVQPGGFPTLAAPATSESSFLVLPKAIPQATLVWGRLAPARTDPEYYALDLADHIIGGSGFQSRLMREIRSDQGLAYSVGSFYQALPEFGVLGAQAGTQTRTAAQVLDLMDQVFATTGSTGVRPEELGRAVDALVNRHVFRYEDPASIVEERMGLILEGLPLDLPERYPLEISAVTAEQVRNAAARYFTRDAGVTVVVGDFAAEAHPWRQVEKARVVSVGP